MRKIMSIVGILVLGLFVLSGCITQTKTPTRNVIVDDHDH